MNAAHIADLALAEFSDRQASARRQNAEGKLALDQAWALLHPWTALAIRLGADVPGLAEMIAALRAPENLIAGAPLNWDDIDCRTDIADRLCPRPKVVAALTAARDAAIRRADPTRAARTTRLATLAAAFGCPAYREEPTRAAA